MDRAFEAEKRRRDELRAQYSSLYAAFTEILFRLDPAGINYETNADEYESEVGTILPRVVNAASAQEIVPILRDEFWRWFGSGITNPDVTWEQLAEELFEALVRYR